MLVAHRIKPHQRTTALDTIVASFRTDPQVRWWFPTDDEYATLAPLFFGTLLDWRIDGGEVWVVDDAAVAMWTPPGGNLLGAAESTRRYEHMLSQLPADVASRVGVLDAAVDALLPEQPHWYLGVLATAASRRGQGLARGVLTPILDHADANGLLCALETGKPGNLAIYERLGFTPVGQASAADAPPVWVLVRPPVTPT